MKVLAVFLTQLAIALCFENRTLFQYLDAQREFSTFVGLIKHANLSDLLKAPGTLTVFAPTNAAFSKLPNGLLVNLQGVDTTAVRNLVMSHLSNGILIAPLLHNGMSVDDLYGTKINVNKYNNGAVVVNGATVTGGDNIVTNGVIHGINSVMFAAQLSISDYMAKDENDYEDLYAALVFTGLEPILDPPGTFTMFAPDNAAFVADMKNIQSVANDRHQFANLLQYHVVNETLYLAGLTDGQKLRTLQGADLSVSIANGVVRINNALIVKADKPMTNGVLHEINTIIIPPIH